jgi:hypothetical protein
MNPRDADALPHPGLGDAGTERGDATDDLMSRHDGEVGGRESTVYEIEVGSTDAADEDADENLSRAGHGVRTFLECEHSRCARSRPPTKDHRTHGREATTVSPPPCPPIPDTLRRHRAEASALLSGRSHVRRTLIRRRTRPPEIGSMINATLHERVAPPPSRRNICDPPSQAPLLSSSLRWRVRQSTRSTPIPLS